ncbi:hypothetical protein FWF48_01595 [Candidatus Saccharibacteria bacterium]|nr:hypothetical protein [Candidatus Saccharibacteria bacterium]
MNSTIITKAFSAEKLKNNILLVAAQYKVPAGQAEDLACAVVHDVEAWLHNRKSATTDDIRRVATQTLTKLHPKLAEFYKTANKII